MKERWKEIAGYEGLYQVSNKGNVRSLDRTVSYKHPKCHKDGRFSYLCLKGRKLTPILRKMSNYLSYYQVNLVDKQKTKTTHIHRLVAEAFIDNPDNKPQVNHKDGNGLNNNVSNLEWVTQSENTTHAYRVLGRVPSTLGKFGESSPKARAVIQLSLSGDFIKRWGSGSEAVRGGGFDSGSITRCCQGVYSSHKNYKWRYAE